MNDIVIEFSTSFNNDGSFKKYHVVAGSIFNECYNETLDSATVVLSQVKKEDRLTKIRPYDYVRVYDTTDEANTSHIYLIDNYQEVEDNITEHIFSYTINLMSETKILEKIQLPNRAATHRVESRRIGKKSIYDYIKEYVDLYCPKVKMASNDSNSYGTWSYQQIISVPNSGTFKTKFDSIKCADLGLTASTLRQALTTFMQQVGCIPTVKNGVLGYLNFQKEAQPFLDNNTRDYTVNKITKSLASDSYANTLVDMSSDVLESGNKVISETIGFRDKNNVLLKQEENLKLEVKFPIYKVQKFEMLGVAGTGTAEVPQSWQSTWVPPNTTTVLPEDCIQILFYKNNNNLTYNGQTPAGFLDFQIGTTNTGTLLNPPISYGGFTWHYWGWNIKNLKLHICRKTETGLDERAFISAENPGHCMNFSNNIYIFPAMNAWSELNGTDNFRGQTYLYFSDITDLGLTYTGPDSQPQNSTDGIFWFEADMVPVLYRYNGSGGVAISEYPSWMVGHKRSAVIYRDDQYHDLSNFTNARIPLQAYCSIDITPLLVEQSQRGLLSRNFNYMANYAKQIESGYETVTIDGKQVEVGVGLANYVYGTVGYSIGSKEISGFSEVYAPGEATVIGWITLNKTYIETIVDFVTSHSSDITLNFYAYSTTVKIGDETYDFSQIYPEDVEIDSEDITLTNDSDNFSFMLFNIEYQPLNTFNLNFVKSKEQIDVPLKQLNTGANGMTDFDRLSIHQQEVVDRIGNETLVISQRTDDPSKIRTFENGPLYFLDDLNRDNDYNDENEDIKYVVFKRSYTINNYHYDVSYSASKDAILKNYFTSIRTKYRAYQYVDYNNSVLRKENETVYVLLSENGAYNADDKIRLGDWNGKITQSEYMYMFIDSIEMPNKKIRAVYERDTANDIAYKNEVSLISNDKMFAIIYEDFDNASPGIRLRKEYENISLNEKLGGIPQEWYLFSDDFNDEPQIMYTFASASNDNDVMNYVGALANNVQGNAYNLPKDRIVTKDFLTSYDKDFVAITLCNDKNSTIDNATLTTNKDYSEQIQRTLEFVYYSDSKNIAWTELFISGNSFVNNASITNLVWCTSSNMDISSNISTTIDGTIMQGSVPVSLIKGPLPYLQVNWGSINSSVNYIKIYSSFSENDTTYYQGVLAFKRGSDNVQKFYVSLNDTKSNYVLSKRNGVLYRKAQIDYNPDGRTYNSGEIPSTTYTINVTALNSNRYTYVLNRTSHLNEASSNGVIQSGATIYYGDTIELLITKNPGFEDYNIELNPNKKVFFVYESNINITIDCLANPYTLYNSLGTGIASVVAQAYRNNQWVTLTGDNPTIYLGEDIKLTFTADTYYRLCSASVVELTVDDDIYAMDYIKSYYYVGELYSPTIYSNLPNDTTSAIYNKYAIKSDGKYYKGIIGIVSNYGELISGNTSSYDYTDIGGSESYTVSANAGNGKYLAVLMKAKPSSYDTTYTLADTGTSWTYDSYTGGGNLNDTYPSATNSIRFIARYDEIDEYTNETETIYTTTTEKTSEQSSWASRYSAYNSNVALAALEDTYEHLPTEFVTQHINFPFEFVVGSTVTLNIYIRQSWQAILNGTATPDYTYSSPGTYTRNIALDNIAYVDPNNPDYELASIVFEAVGSATGQYSAVVKRNQIHIAGVGTWGEESVTLNVYGNGYTSRCADVSGNNQSQWRLMMYPGTNEHYLYYYNGSSWTRGHRIEYDSDITGTQPGEMGWVDGLFGRILNEQYYYYRKWNASSHEWQTFTVSYKAPQQKFAIYNGGNSWTFTSTNTNTTYRCLTDNEYYKWNGSAWSNQTINRWVAYKSNGVSWSADRALNNGDVYKLFDGYVSWNGSGWSAYTVNTYTWTTTGVDAELNSFSYSTDTYYYELGQLIKL